MVQQGGMIDGQRIVPKGWFEEAGSPKIINGKTVNYGYLWWPLLKNDALQEKAFKQLASSGNICT